MLGRRFVPDDPLNVAVIGTALWRRRFSGGRSVIGRRITLDGEPYTVIGVMPEGFQFPYRDSPAELWLPWQPPPQFPPGRRVDIVVARLRQGVGIEKARSGAADPVSRG
jgi:putative ABC transport system permease protein